MRLSFADPRSLAFNPDNPRRTPASPMSDEQLAANIKELGVLQPPLVREKPDGALTVILGERRVKAAISAGREGIPILILDADESDDRIRALSENIQRAAMNPVDQWRAIEAAISDRWTEDAIAAVMGLSIRIIRRLRLLANIQPQMLDVMARGDLPNENCLRTIAAASADEQASVWKKYRPKKGQANVSWHEVSRALEKHRMSAAVAKFGPDEEKAFGIVWQEDLFEQGDKDCRYTTQVEAFISAQEAWLSANLPKNGVLLGADDYGRPQLPPKAQSTWGKPRAGDSVGCYVDPRTGAISEIGFSVPKAEGRKGKDGGGDGASPKAVRPAITQKGVAKIGDYRTEALHQALRSQPIADDTLIALLVFALAARNVTVETAHGRFRSERDTVAARLVDGACITGDTDRVRSAAREILVEVLSCREGLSNSGVLALLAGETIGADAFLPNMATDEFLTCLSKAGVEGAARTANVLPRNTGKETRAALIKEVGQSTFILPAARFTLPQKELDALAARARADANDGVADEPPDELEPAVDDDVLVAA